MRSLSYTEAVELARTTGVRIRHEYFTNDEFFEFKDGKIVCEDGYAMDGWYRNERWQNVGWSVHNRTTFGELNDGAGFTVENLSGSFVKVLEESSLYNAVAHYRSSASFKFNDGDIVYRLPKEIETEE